MFAGRLQTRGLTQSAASLSQLQTALSTPSALSSVWTASASCLLDTLKLLLWSWFVACVFGERNACTGAFLCACICIYLTKRSSAYVCVHSLIRVRAGSVLANLLPRGVGAAVVNRLCPKVYIPNPGHDAEMDGFGTNSFFGGWGGDIY